MSDTRANTKPASAGGARERILDRLRAARPDAAPDLPDVGALFAPHTPEDQAILADRFQRAIEASHAEVHRVTNADLAETVARTLREKGIRRVAVGRATLGDGVLAGALGAAAELVPVTEDVEAAKPALFREIDAGFTVARSAIADTGSVVLWPGPSEPRTLSLVPSIHLVLLDSAAVHPNLYAAMQAEDWRAGLPTNVVLVSGPSKTADIQQTLAYGAHGPKEVVVLLKMPQGTAR